MKRHFESIPGVLIALSVIAVLAFRAADDPFLSRVSEANLAEIAAGKLAVSKGNSADVKKYAQKMVDDHTLAQKDLQLLARRESLSIPKEPDADHQAVQTQLMNLTGSDFDSAYLGSQQRDHYLAVSLFQAELAGGSDPDAVAYAKKYLPAVQMHLNMIKSFATGSNKISGDSLQ